MVQQLILLEAISVAEKIGYPVLVRPPFVLGGEEWQIVYSTEELKQYMDEAVSVSKWCSQY